MSTHPRWGSNNSPNGGFHPSTDQWQVSFLSLFTRGVTYRSLGDPKTATLLQDFIDLSLNDSTPITVHMQSPYFIDLPHPIYPNTSPNHEISQRGRITCGYQGGKEQIARLTDEMWGPFHPLLLWGIIHRPSWSATIKTVIFGMLRRQYFTIVSSFHKQRLVL